MPGPKHLTRSQMKLPYGSNNVSLQFDTSVAVGNVSNGQTKNDVLNGVLTFKLGNSVVQTEDFIATWFPSRHDHTGDGVFVDNIYHVESKSVSLDVSVDSTVKGTINKSTVSLVSKPGQAMLVPVGVAVPALTLCDELTVAKAVLASADTSVIDFRVSNAQADVIREGIVERHYQVHGLVKNNVSLVATLASQVVNKFVEFENKTDEVIATSSTTLRTAINADELLTNVTANISDFATEYLTMKKNQETELLALRSEAVNMETIICSNNAIIKENFQLNARGAIDIFAIHLKTASEIVENISTSYKSLPESILKTPQFVSMSAAFELLLTQAATCKPSDAAIRACELDLLQDVVSASEVFNDLLGHQCNKIIDIIDDFLFINTQEQNYIEASLVFDSEPTTDTLFNVINPALVQMGDITGTAISRLTEANEEVLSFETEFQTFMDSSIKVVEKLHTPLTCLGDKIDMLLQGEINKFSTTSNLNKSLILAKTGFDAMRDFNENTLALGNVIVTSVKELASVCNSSMADIYDTGVDIMNKEIFKNQTVSQYFALNTSSVSTLLNSNISPNMKIFTGTSFVLVGICVRTFATDQLVNNLPQLPIVDSAYLNDVNNNIDSLLRKAAVDLLLRAIDGIALKLESTRIVLVSFGDKILLRANEISTINHNTAGKVITLLPPITQDIKRTISSFTDIISLGLNATLDSVSTNLTC